MGNHVFKDHGGALYPKGKPTWPDSLRVEMTKGQLIAHIQSVTLQLGSDHPQFYLVGKLHEEDDNGDRI